MTVIERLASFVASVQAGQAPPAAVDALRLHLFDTLVAAHATATTPEAAAMRALVADSGTGGDVPALGLGVRTAAPLAALATCAATRCTEIDDIDLPSCTTPGSVVVPTALALSHLAPSADAEALLSGLLAGYEVLTRFGQAVDGPNVLYRGIWPTYLAGGLGATATAARMLGLDAAATAHALAAAATLATGTSGRARGPSSRWLTLGCAVHNGILAAMAARRGVHGDLTILDGAWSRITGIALDTAALLEGLGQPFAIQRVSIKPYCAAKQVTSSMAAFAALLDERVAAPAAIERVIVAVPPAYAQMIDQPTPPPERLGGIVSAQYQLALAAYYRDELLDVERAVPHGEPEFRALMSKVEVQAEPSLAPYFPRAYPARVTVQTAAGQAAREVRHTAGDPSHPFTWDGVLAKAQRALRGHVAAPAVEGLAASCRMLGESATLGTLHQALAAMPA